MEDKIMVKAEVNTFIKAPVNKVWEVLNDTERLPEWMPLLEDINDIQGEGVGSTFNWKYKFLGIKFKGSSKIEEQEAGKKHVMKSKAGIESIWTWNFTPEGDGTKVNLNVEYTIPVPVLGKYAEKYVVKQGKRDMEYLMDNFKHFLEG